MQTVTPAEARALEAKAMTEREFQNCVVELARACQWRIVHFRPAWTAKGWRTPLQGDPGFFDLVLARPDAQAPRLIFAELKAERGKLTEAQKSWQTALGDAAHRDWEYYVWRPSMWEEIAEVLSPYEAMKP